MSKKFLFLGTTTLLSLIALSCDRSDQSVESETVQINGKNLEIKKSVIGEAAGFNPYDGDNCTKNRGNCAWAIVENTATSKMKYSDNSRWNVKFIINDNKLLILNADTIHASTSANVNIPIERQLPSSIVKQLGYESITILPGNYEYKTAGYKEGYLEMDIVKK